MMDGGRGELLLPLYDREAAAGRRLHEQTLQQYCFLVMWSPPFLPPPSERLFFIVVFETTSLCHCKVFISQYKFGCIHYASDRSERWDRGMLEYQNITGEKTLNKISV